MHETNLDITIYTKPDCKESDRTVAEFLVNQVGFISRDITTDPDARMALEGLMKNLSTPKPVVTPTVVAECSCGKHVEWWSGYNSSRRDRLFAMVRHLVRFNAGEVDETTGRVIGSNERPDPMLEQE